MYTTKCDKKIHKKKKMENKGTTNFDEEKKIRNFVLKEIAQSISLRKLSLKKGYTKQRR